ncbi:MAG: NAD(P)H-dependent oxidoreductase subunit E [Acidobacteria bacterium]|nr:NAD(P)H-dependent oxidoreductase subunit E [Acidobacteriota bacterium]
MSFEYTPENLTKLQEMVGRYRVKRAALLPALNLAQQQLGYISPEVEDYVAGLLNVPVVDVHEVVTFYTLYKQRPSGRHHIRLCRNISCWLRGSESIEGYLNQSLGAGEGEVSQDGRFSWEKVECLGACEIAPMLQLDDDYYGSLTREKVEEILKNVKD